MAGQNSLQSLAEMKKILKNQQLNFSFQNLQVPRL